MIYLFSGDDTKKKVFAYEEFLKTLPEGMPVFFINKNDFDPVQIESFYSGASLFAAKSAVVLRDILAEPARNASRSDVGGDEIQEFILSKLPLLGESQNTFIFIEGKLKKPALDAFKNLSRLPAGSRAELNIFELPKAKKEKYDNFLVANAFAARDKFHTWLYFRQAVDLGVSLDELAGVLFWKIKDMLLRQNFSKWKEGELKNFAARISYLLPGARKQGPEAESALEQFLLEAF